MKSKNKDRLQLDNIRYCEQIGIHSTTRPRLVFSRKEVNAFRKGKGYRNESKNVLGRCYTADQVVYIAERTRDGYVKERVDGKRWYRLVRKPYNYTQQKKVLVHELVHYRFPKMTHGKKFEQRVNEILRGRRFEPL